MMMVVMSDDDNGGGGGGHWADDDDKASGKMSLIRNASAKPRVMISGTAESSFLSGS